MGPRFVRIPKTSKNELLKLERDLVDALPKSAQLLMVCRLLLQDKIPEGVDVEFYKYSKSDEVKDDKTDLFVFCVERPNIHTNKGIIVFTPDDINADMVRAFDEIIGWSEAQVFHCVQPPFWSHLEKMLEMHRNLKPDNTKGILGIMLSISDKEKIVDPCLPGPQYELKPVGPENVKLIVEQWKWRAPHSEDAVRKCITTMISAGLFYKGNGNEELVSSVLQSPLGEFNILHTPEEHRRRGFGITVMEWATKQVATNVGVPVLAEVEIWNEPSKKLLEKVGFTELYKTKWYYFDPPHATLS